MDIRLFTGVQLSRDCDNSANCRQPRVNTFESALRFRDYRITLGAKCMDVCLWRRGAAVRNATQISVAYGRSEDEGIQRQPKTTLVIPGSVTYRESLLEQVSDAVRTAAGVALGEGCERFLHELLSAIGEAFNNIALHAYAGCEPDDVQVDLDFDDERVTAVFKDYGRQFDPLRVGAPELDELPESGMGLFIISSFLDKLDYQPGSPNTLTMRKQFPGGSRREF
jgi:serine/threonine-protein kinase RsbW